MVLIFITKRDVISILRLFVIDLFYIHCLEIFPRTTMTSIATLHPTYLPQFCVAHSIFPGSDHKIRTIVNT